MTQTFSETVTPLADFHMPLHFLISPGTKSRWRKILSWDCSVIIELNWSWNCQQHPGTSLKGSAAATPENLWKPSQENQTGIWGIFCFGEAGSCEVIPSCFGIEVGNTEMKTAAAAKYFWTFYSLTSLSSDFKEVQDAVFYLSHTTFRCSWTENSKHGKRYTCKFWK